MSVQTAVALLMYSSQTLRKVVSVYDINNVRKKTKVSSRYWRFCMDKLDTHTAEYEVTENVNTAL